MIPLKLHLKNFLSYGPTIQVVDFGSYPLICLSGKNGHGKSALLDAITWVLWGQARKSSGTAKPDAQLLRLGQTSMMVMLDFYFNGQTYRVKREFTLTRSENSYASLEVGIVDETTNVIHPLTNKTIRESQATIETLLGLDFDGFVNSAFLRQGQANEFSKKSPKERKDLLATILQLDTYENLRKQAQEKVKNAQQEILRLQQLQQRIHIELAKDAELHKAHQIVQEELAMLKKNIETNQASLVSLEEKKKIVIDRKQKQSVLVYQVEHIIEEQNQSESLVVQLFNQWRVIQRKTTHLNQTHALEEEKKVVTQQLTNAQRQHQELLEIKEKYLKSKELEQDALNKIKESYYASLKKKEVYLERLQVELNHQVTYITQISTAHTNNRNEHETIETSLTRMREQKNLFAQPETIQQLEQQFEKGKTYYHKWIARSHMLKTEQENLEQKKHLVYDTSNPSCPLCEQNLSASRKRFLDVKFDKTAVSLDHRLARLSRVLKKLKNRLIEQHATLTTLKKDGEQAVALHYKQEELEKKSTQITQIATELSTALQTALDKKQELESLIQSEHQLMTQMIAHHQKALEESPYSTYKQERESYEQQIKQKADTKLSYDLLLKKLDLLHQQEKMIHELKEEVAQQEIRKKEIHTLCVQLKSYKKTRLQLQQELAHFQTLAHEEQEITTTTRMIHANLESLQSQRDRSLQEVGRILQEQNNLNTLKHELNEYSKEIFDLTATVEDYQILVQTFGKDGIQALLIEDALPEIEHEANSLLAKLTYNQAHIIIESLRDLKKGGTKETLDIKISDPMGIRPYELFSGGEAFRIDFALRIAISKLLARRAGTSLKTLIIDEGFGSQDEEGLSLLMDAIYKIQDDFAKVIIVSHLSAMKDQFPVHFLIQKSAQGSTVEVIEQG
jgi:DNA repair protein SbcC/Rad50